jgi:hypothetical protein
MIIIRLIALAFGVACLSGCFARKFKSMDLIPASASIDRSGLSTITVAIEKKQNAHWLVISILEDLSKDLKSTGIFKDVILTDDIKSLAKAPDLILAKHTKDSELDAFHSCSLGFEGVMITIGTLGLIPQICKNNFVETYILSVPRNGKEIEIKIKYEIGNVVGWAALFYAFSPEWTLSHKNIENQYINAIRSAFSTKSDDVRNALK